MRQTLARAFLIMVTLFVVAIYYVPIGHVDFAENWGEGTFGIALPPQRLMSRPLIPIPPRVARECAPAIDWSCTVTMNFRRACGRRIRASVKR